MNNDASPNDQIKYLIDNYLLPALAILNSNGRLISQFYDLVKLKDTIKHEHTETPGTSNDGRLWFSIGAVCHSYSYNEATGKKTGTRIYKKQQFIFDEGSLIEGTNRADFIEMLEPGKILYIYYVPLLELMQQFPELDAAIMKQCLLQWRYIRHHDNLLKEEPLERVRKFLSEQPEFIRCSSQETQSIHLQMSLRTYVSQLKLLRAGH